MTSLVVGRGIVVLVGRPVLTRVVVLEIVVPGAFVMEFHDCYIWIFICYCLSICLSVF